MRCVLIVLFRLNLKMKNKADEIFGQKQIIKCI